MSSKNTAHNRQVLIASLPPGSSSNEIIQELFKSQNFKFSDIDLDGSSAIVTLSDVSEAKRAAKLINGQLFKGQRISVTEAPPPAQKAKPSGPSSGSSFVVVGNLSFDFTEDQFRTLMSPHGEIKNLFLVRGKLSKKSKGYGFVEYKQRESAVRAKSHYLKSSGAKFVEGRIVRVEIVPSNLSIGEEKHSRSLFVDKLPKFYDNDELLKNMFASRGTVTFCKIARSRDGEPRGYALIDYSNVIEAEKAQQQLDGTQVGNSRIRISFCTPGTTAQETLGGKFDDQSLRPSLLGPPGPGVPNFFGVNPLVPMHGPGFPQPGLPGPFIGDISGPRPIPMNMMQPRPFFGVSSVPGPFPRVPGGQPRPHGIYSMRPNSPAGRGINKNQYGNKSWVRTIQPRNSSEGKTTPAKKTPLVAKTNSVSTTSVTTKATDSTQANTSTSPSTKPSGKTNDFGNEVKAEESKVADKKQSIKKDDEGVKEKVSKAQTSNEIPKDKKKNTDEIINGKSQSLATEEMKDSQRVFDLDPEQLKQFKLFQQFQELLKKQEEVEKSGESVSLEDLVAAAKGIKEAKKKECDEASKAGELKKQGVSSVTQQDSSKHTLQESGHLLSTNTSESKPSSGSTKPVTPSPAVIKLSPAIANSPTVANRNSPGVSKFSVPSARIDLTTKPPATNKTPITKSPVTTIRSGSTRTSTTKSSHAPARSTSSRQDTPRPVQRHEKFVSPPSSQSSHPRSSSSHHQRSNTNEQKSTHGHSSSSYERKNYERNSYHDAKSPSTSSRNDSSSSPTQLPANTKVESSILQKLFNANIVKKQDYGSDQHTTANQSDSRSNYGSPYQSGGTSNLPDSEISRGTPKSTGSQPTHFGYSKQYESTDGYASNRSPANESTASWSRYTLPKRLPQTPRGDATPPPSRYERQPERELVSYPRPGIHLRQGNPRDIKPSYAIPQSRTEPGDPVPTRDTNSIREPVASRSLTSLRDILPAREESGDIFPPRDRAQRDYAPRDIAPREEPPRDMLRSRDNISSREITPRGVPPRDDGFPRNLARVRGMENLRGREAYTQDSPSRHHSSPEVGRESLDRARFERVLAGPREARNEYPAYGRELPNNRYRRELPTRESAMGTIRGAPARYPMDGPQSKRPRY